MKYYFLILPIIICTNEIKSQTVVIAKKINNSIYVAADSRIRQQRFDHAKNEYQTDTGSMCKIGIIGKMNFAVIGGSIQSNKEIATEVCSNENSFLDIRSEYIKKFGAIIQADVINIRTVLPPYEYSKYVAEYFTGFYSQCIFFGINADTLFTQNILCVIEDPYSTPVKIKWQRSYAIDVEFGGDILEIKDSVNNPKAWQGNVVEALRNFISAQAQRHPDKVGGSIDIVRFTKDKIEWVSKKKECN